MPVVKGTLSVFFSSAVAFIAVGCVASPSVPGERRAPKGTVGRSGPSMVLIGAGHLTGWNEKKGPVELGGERSWAVPATPEGYAPHSTSGVAADRNGHISYHIGDFLVFATDEFDPWSSSLSGTKESSGTIVEADRWFDVGERLKEGTLPGPTPADFPNVQGTPVQDWGFTLFADTSPHLSSHVFWANEVVGIGFFEDDFLYCSHLGTVKRYVVSGDGPLEDIGTSDQDKLWSSDLPNLHCGGGVTGHGTHIVVSGYKKQGNGWKQYLVFLNNETGVPVFQREVNVRTTENEWTNRYSALLPADGAAEPRILKADREHYEQYRAWSLCSGKLFPTGVEQFSAVDCGVHAQASTGDLYPDLIVGLASFGADELYVITLSGRMYEVDPWEGVHGRNDPIECTGTKKDSVDCTEMKRGTGRLYLEGGAAVPGER